MSNMLPMLLDDTPSMDLNKIRKVWHNEEWYYSVVDFISLTSQRNQKQALNYWRNLKCELKHSINTNDNAIANATLPIKQVAADGKQRYTDFVSKTALLYLHNELMRGNIRRKELRLQNGRDEVEQFHPYVEVYLREKGFEVKHHVNLSSGCVIDFVAAIQGQILIIECKQSITKTRLFEAIGQVLCYTSEYGKDSIPCIATTAHYIKDNYTIKTCAALGINLLEIPA